MDNDLPDIEFGDIEFGEIEEIEEDEEHEERVEENLGPDIIRITGNDEIDKLVDEDCFIVYKSCLMTLANKNYNRTCRIKGCSLPLDIKQRVIGSAMYFKWVSYLGFSYPMNSDKYDCC